MFSFFYPVIVCDPFQALSKYPKYYFLKYLHGFKLLNIFFDFRLQSSPFLFACEGLKKSLPLVTSAFETPGAYYLDQLSGDVGDSFIMLWSELRKPGRASE